MLVVRADNRRVPGTREGWWNWGGITRAVSLVPRGPVVLHDAGVLPRRHCKGGDCRWETIVDGWLENRSSRSQRPSVRLSLRSPDGETLAGRARARARCAPASACACATRSVRGKAKLWAPEDPQLYDATVRTVLGGRAIQTDHRRIGLRTVSVVDGALRLNGRTLDLRGASIQEDVPGPRPGAHRRRRRDDVAELKALGANVTRAHYLLDERLLRRFDEEGILVWSQAPVYHRDAHAAARRASARTSSTRCATRSSRRATTRRSSRTRSPTSCPRSPTRSRRRGCGCSTPPSSRATSTRRCRCPSTCCPIRGIARQKTYEAFDMLGINSYYGWYPGKPERSTANLDDLAPYLRAMHAKYPQQGARDDRVRRRGDRGRARPT